MSPAPTAKPPCTVADAYRTQEEERVRRLMMKLRQSLLMFVAEIEREYNLTRDGRR